MLVVRAVRRHPKRSVVFTVAVGLALGASASWPVVRAALGPSPSDGAATGAGASASACAEPPTAYVFEGAQSAAGAWLHEAGFTVQPLPLDRSPFGLRGLVALGSGASARRDYARYMRRYGADLYAFVDKGNVVLQLPQDAKAEASPPFLPTTHDARRGGRSLTRLYALDGAHPLLAGLPLSGEGARQLTPPEGRLVQGFAAQGGFEVILARDGTARDAALMEGAYGQGRIVLSAVPFDLPQPRETDAALVGRFGANLRAAVRAVCQRRTRALRVTPAATAAAFETGSSFLAVLPDTQVYSLLHPGLLTVQTAWLAAQARARDLRFVLHLGDIVNNNTELEWQRAARAMALLDAAVPYAVVPGNHDYGPSGDASTRETLLNDHFSFARAAAAPTFGGAFEHGRLDNTYHLVSVGGRELVILALEWAPRDRVIAWANEVMRRHGGREGVLVTHAYLNHNDRRLDHTDRAHPQHFNPHEYSTPGGVNDGEELWQKLVRHHRFILVLAGHVLQDGTGYLASQTDRGTTCHQILSNYQMRALGGEGYLRLLEFLGDGRTVRVHSYSPLHDSYLWEQDQAFSFLLDAAPPPEQAVARAGPADHPPR